MTQDNPELRLISWNVERASIDRFRTQLEKLQERTPDIVALQEVGIKASRKARQLLREHGFEYSAHSHEYLLEDPGKSSGAAFASRWPFRVLPPETFDMPYQHQALSAEFYTPFGRIEGHTVHILPGSQYGETKFEMFDGVYNRLAVDDPPEYRFLCGDFNSPESETADGETNVWGSNERRRNAEYRVIRGLADYDLADAYRDVNGYGDDAYSYVTKNHGSEWPRRFDHVFASGALNATAAEYPHQYDNLSDHTPLEVVFEPVAGLEEGASLERAAFDAPPESDASAEPSGEASASFPGLEYEDDIRRVAPEQNYRRGRFKAGWNAAVDGDRMGDALAELTWENLGWRLGMLFDDASEELQEELYEWCVDHQLETR